LIVELPKGDFAFTVVRQFLFSVAALYHMDALSRSTHGEIAGIAAKAAKESRYHVRHAGDWVLKLGDGTEESHRRSQAALDSLWRYTGELFLMDAVDEALIADGIAPKLDEVEAKWRETVTDVIRRATLRVPDSGYMQRGGRAGRHTEALGHLLSEMQILQRSHPGAKW
jgi:ring-1,2-phenylacetyl-CoA epoxidase subunit PaaC